MAAKKDYRFIDRKKHSKKACGYCWSHVHRGFLTVALLKEHKCIDKHCNCLQVYPEHPFWIEREKKRKMRAEKKRLRQEENIRANKTGKRSSNNS